MNHTSTVNEGTVAKLQPQGRMRFRDPHLGKPTPPIRRARTNDRVGPVLVLSLSILWVGCTASRPLTDMALGAGGALAAKELSHGNPAITAAGAAGGVLLSEGAYYLARKETAKAYASGYDKGRSDAAKQQYWLYVGLQRHRDGTGQVRLYPIQLPEQRIDGAIFKSTVKNLRIEE